MGGVKMMANPDHPNWMERATFACRSLLNVLGQEGYDAWAETLGEEHTWRETYEAAQEQLENIVAQQKRRVE